MSRSPSAPPHCMYVHSSGSQRAGGSLSWRRPPGLHSWVSSEEYSSFSLSSHVHLNCGYTVLPGSQKCITVSLEAARSSICINKETPSLQIPGKKLWVFCSEFCSCFSLNEILHTWLSSFISHLTRYSVLQPLPQFRALCSPLCYVLSPLHFELK